MMPVSMTIGLVFYSPLSHLGFIMPYLIFGMLLITYTNISLNEIRLSKMHACLLTIQLGGSVAVYSLVQLYNPIVAQAALICFLAPTASSAVVITGMLGGNIASLTAFSLLSNIAVAIVAPIIFTTIGGGNEIPFWIEVCQIGQRIFVLLLLPFILAIGLANFLPKLHLKIKKAQQVSFYLWNIALITATSRTLKFLMQEGSANLNIAIAIAIGALVACCLQFFFGRKIGKHYNDTIAGGQALGQKNTILSIWMAQSYLNPISSIGPGAYILWQNIINSYQIFRKTKT